MTAYIRTQSPEIRAQQWTRMRDCTYAYALDVELARTLRAFLLSAKAYQVVAWHYPMIETEVLKDLAKIIKQGQERLDLATDNLLALNGELEALKTALTDDEGSNSI